MSYTDIHRTFLQAIATHGALSHSKAIKLLTAINAKYEWPIVRAKITAMRKDGVEQLELDLGSSQEASTTDSETIQREAEKINIDGLNVAQMNELRDKVPKFFGGPFFRIR